MTPERTHAGWVFWLWWVLASPVGWAGGSVFVKRYPGDATTKDGPIIGLIRLIWWTVG